MRRSIHSSTPRRRTGLVLIVCMLVIAFTSALSLGILRTQACRLSLAANICDYSQAEALAVAGIEHGIATLVDDSTWRGDSGWLQLTNGDAEYRFLVEADSAGVRIEAVGRSGGVSVTRELQHAF